MYSYYLLNGKNGKGKALNIESKNMVYRSFKDISQIDLLTMDIKDSDKEKVLSEHNKDLSGMFYIASFPHKVNETKTYAPIFDDTTEKTKKYLKALKNFALERKNKVDNKEKLSLDVDRKFMEYINNILYELLNSYNVKMLDNESLIAANLKDLIRDRFSEYKNMGTTNYMKMRKHNFINYLCNYTQLRYLTLEYMRILDKKSIIRRSDINRPSGWENQGMIYITPFEVKKNEETNEIEEFRQMTIDDYIKPKTLKKKIDK